MIVEWTPRARRELKAQVRYIAKDKPSAALRMAEITEQHASMLSAWPNIGKLSGTTGILELAIPKTPFVIRYRVGLDVVRIVRLFHGAQKRA